MGIGIGSVWLPLGESSHTSKTLKILYLMPGGL